MNSTATRLRRAVSLSLAAIMAVVVAHLVSDWGPTIARPTVPHPRHRTDFAPPERVPQASPDRPSPASFDVHPGTELVFRIDTRWRIRLTSASDGSMPSATSRDDPKDQRVGARLRGSLVVTVLDREEEAYVLRVQLRAPQLDPIGDTANPQGTSAGESLLDPLLVRLGRDGRVLGFAWGTGMPARSRSTLIQLVTLTHQFVLDDGYHPAWTASGLRDEFGLYVGHFARAGRAIRRSVVRYEGIDGSAIPSGSSRAVFSDGWIQSARARERRTIPLLDLRVASDVAIRAQLVARSTVGIEDLADVRSIAWQLDLPGEPGDQPEPPAPDAIALEGLIDQLVSLAGAGELDREPAFRAWLDLTRAIVGQPSLLPRVRELLLDAGVDRGVRRMIATALGSSAARGSTGGARVLADVVGDPQADPEIRAAALMGAHEIDALADLVAPSVAALAATGVGPLSDVEVAAGLLLGTLAGRDLPPGQADLINDAMEAFRQRAFAAGEPETYFRALANSERPELVAEALEWVHDPDPRLRAAAAEAVGHLGHEAHEVLIALAENDPATPVSVAAVRALGQQWPASPQVTSFLAHVATSSANVAILREAVSSLAGLALRGDRRASARLMSVAESTSAAATLARQYIGDLSGAPSREHG